MNGTWKVTGRRAYRGHQPGETFDARLEGNAAARAIKRGDIVLVEEHVAGLPERYELPEGWNDRV